MIDYVTRHEWYRNHFRKTSICEECGRPSLDWHETNPKRAERVKRSSGLRREDVMELCRLCHAAKHNDGKCKRGHDLTPPGARANPTPSRPLGQCRKCMNDYGREYQRKHGKRLREERAALRGRGIVRPRGRPARQTRPASSSRTSRPRNALP